MIADDVAQAVVAVAVVGVPVVLRDRVAIAAGVLAASSFLFSPGALATALVAPYALFCAWVAAAAALRIAARGLRPASVLVANLAQVYLGGAAVWLVAHRAGHALLGYPPLWVLLTAAHFHVAGFYLTSIAALHRHAVAVLVALAIPLTAAGIHGPRWLETSAALATTAGAMGVALLALRTRRPLHVLSGLLLLGGMALAGAYALRAHVPAFTIAGLDPLSSMVVTHAVANTAAVALALLAFTLAPPPPLAPFAPPFSRLAAGLHVGARFFADRGLERTPSPPSAPPRGLVDALDELAHPGNTPAAVAPAIRAFYERTHDHALVVRPRWRAGFRTGARLFARLARRTGQLQLPVTAERGDEGITSRIVAIEPTEDGRPSPRAWIRTFADGRAMYVAAYATHVTAATAYMNIAFPLPGGHLASILRLDNVAGTDGGVVLSTRTGGDAGIWLCARAFGRTWPLRLPLAETIAVWTRDDPAAPAELRALAPPGATSIARHDLWLCGVHYLTLDYAMTPLTPMPPLPG